MKSGFSFDALKVLTAGSSRSFIKLPGRKMSENIKEMENVSRSDGFQQVFHFWGKKDYFCIMSKIHMV